MMRGVVVVKTFYLVLVNVPKTHLIKTTQNLASKKNGRAHMIMLIIVVDKLNYNAKRGKKENMVINMAERGLGK